MPVVTETKLKIYAPWALLYRQIEALFEKDPEVTVAFDSENNDIQLYVDDEKKAEALAHILPVKKTFGNVVVTITVIPANNTEKPDEWLAVAFKGNEAFSHITTISDIPDVYISNPITYCVFKKEVVQYPADNLSTESGMNSTLYENLARDIFTDLNGVYFCTDTK